MHKENAEQGVLFVLSSWTRVSTCLAKPESIALTILPSLTESCWLRSSKDVWAQGRQEIDGQKFAKALHEEAVQPDE